METINKAIVRNQQQDQQIMVPHSVQPSPTDSPVMATNPRQSVGSSGSELHPPLSIRRSNSYNGSAALRQVVTSSSGGGELLVVGRSTFSGQIPLPSIARVFFAIFSTNPIYFPSVPS